MIISQTSKLCKKKISHRDIDRIIALVMDVIITTLGFFLLESGISSREYYFSFLRAFNSWFWLVTIFGFGNKYLNSNNRVLKYTNESVLPFYIIHQTVIVTIGFYLANWDASVIVKYLVHRHLPQSSHYMI